jgi:hypothetical protein
MSTAPLVAQPASTISPRIKARLAGLCYLICGTAYTFADGSVRGKLVVAGDAAATARNILAHQALYRLGFAAELVSVVAYLAVTLLLYDLLNPVSRLLSFSAAVFSFLGCTVQAVTSLFHLAPMILLSGDHGFAALNTDQLQALALISLKIRTQSASVYMVFFGWYCLLLGCLIIRSKFFPRVIGCFLLLAGASYQLFLFPQLANQLFRYVIAPAGTLGELSLVLWLLVVGVNADKWREQARAAGASV